MSAFCFFLERQRAQLSSEDKLVYPLQVRAGLEFDIQTLQG